LKGRNFDDTDDIRHNMMALGTVQQWCDRTKLSSNPKKMAVMPFTRKRNIKGLTELIHYNKRIQLSSEVKYLGLTLDKGLTWKKRLDKVTDKAYKVFWTCRGTFGKTWELKPKVVHWIYTAVVRPIVTYAATIWWPRVTLKTSQGELNKSQRVACLGIAGAMRTAPTAAMEVLLGLPPLHLQMGVEARRGNYKLRCNEQWKPKSEGFGQAYLTRDMESEPILQMGSDKMTLRHVYENPTIRFPDRCEWNKGFQPDKKMGTDLVYRWF
jgi:hypothetical protein